MIKKATQAPNDRDTLKLVGTPGESEELIKARGALSPTAGNAITARLFAKNSFGDDDLTACHTVLAESAQKLNAGDLSGLESLLNSQAIVLDKVFNELARRASLNMGTHMAATESYMRLALKAQSQCRATVESLANIKNPPIVYAKQANIAHGPQQVNNGVLPEQYAQAHTGAENSENPQNKLLGRQPPDVLTQVHSPQTQKVT
jgi:hypothetical protein